MQFVDQDVVVPKNAYPNSANPCNSAQSMDFFKVFVRAREARKH